MGPDIMIFVFWMLSFKPTFSLSSFTFIKRLISSLLSAIKVVSSAHLRLLIFLPAIVIPPCASSSPALCPLHVSLIGRVRIHNLDTTWHEELTHLKTDSSGDAGKDWRQGEKGTTEDEMVGWHHWLDGHEFEQASRVGDGQGSLVCSSPWGLKELDTTEWLNWLID